MKLPNQIKLKNSVKSIPIEYFKWGNYPDHFKIDMPHRHNFSEILFFTKGGGYHEIDYNNYQAVGRSIQFIPKSTVHFLKRDIDSEGFTIAYDDQYLDSNNVHKIVNPLPSEPFQLIFNEHRFERILDQSKVLLAQINESDSYYKSKCFLLSIELLMNTIASEFSNQYSHQPDVKISELTKKFKYLAKTNIHKHHTVSWYATQLQISAKTLGNHIKKNLGLSPKMYLQQTLLTSVKRNLIDSNKSLKEIAIDHNYNLSQLGKLFKKNVSYTMKEYRSRD